MTKHRVYQITTRALAGQCTSCRMETFVGFVEGLRVTVDSSPIACIGPSGGIAQAELDALADGARLYVRGVTGELNERTAAQYENPTLYGNVHVEHACGLQQAIGRRAR